MIKLDRVFLSQTPAKPLNETHQQMLFSLKEDQQTFIRYVLPDGASSIIYSFDQPRDFVNGDLSPDTRILHLTEQCTIDGKVKYFTTIIDTQNKLKTFTIQSSEYTNGVFLKYGRNKPCYQMLHFVGKRLTQIAIKIDNNQIRFHKKRSGLRIKNVKWWRFSQQTQTLILITTDNVYKTFIFNEKEIINDRSVEIDLEQRKDAKQNFYCFQNGKATFVAEQFFEEKDECSFIVRKYPSKKCIKVIIRDLYTDEKIGFYYFDTILFAYSPNKFICLVDVKGNFQVYSLRGIFAKMPLTDAFTPFYSNYVADSTTGSIYAFSLSPFNSDKFKDYMDKTSCSAFILIASRTQNSEITKSLFDFVVEPSDAVNLFRLYLHQNGDYGYDVPIPYFSVYQQKHFDFYLEVSEKIHDHLIAINEALPSASFKNRLYIFTEFVKALNEQKYASGIKDSFQKALILIDRQNMVVIHFREALTAWEINVNNSDLLNLIFCFALHSETAFISYPQVPRIKEEIKLRLLKSTPFIFRKQLMAVGIYGTDLYLPDEYNSREVTYWSQRYDVKESKKKFKLKLKQRIYDKRHPNDIPKKVIVHHRSNGFTP